MQFIDLKQQQQLIRQQIDKRISDVLSSGRYIMGPEVEEVEQRLAKFVGVKHCVSVSSGTTALLVALKTLGISPGDEVITTPFSFFASVEAILLLGADPVFVDIDPATYNINTQLLGAAITPRTKAIMPVSLFGQCADMTTINAIAKQHGLAVIEDGAQSFGALYQGKRSCGLSTIGCTSFYPAKPLGCYGDGGACFTDDDALAQLMRELRNHGESGHYNHVRVGITGRLDTLQAAVLLAKLDIFDQEIAQRQQVAQWYYERLSGKVTLPFVASENQSAYAQFTIRVKQRQQVIPALTAAGIPCAVHYAKALHQQAAFTDTPLSQLHFPLAERAACEVLSLPFHPYLTVAQVGEVAEQLLQAMEISAAVES